MRIFKVVSADPFSRHHETAENGHVAGGIGGYAADDLAIANTKRRETPAGDIPPDDFFAGAGVTHDLDVDAVLIGPEPRRRLVDRGFATHVFRGGDRLI